MRVEYKFGLDQVGVPCFSVEATEGPAKLFTLSTLVINVISVGDCVDVIFTVRTSPISSARSRPS